jgi:P-loop Domain of unknown function (DUF2791)
VADYLDSVANVNDTRSYVVPVRGDYGTGKTHLLRDVAMAVQRAAGEQAAVVGASFLEADPLTWYRNAIGPILARLPLQEALLAVYSQAAMRVAGQAELTAGAVDRMAADHGLARELVNQELLSSSDVDLAFQEMLEEICLVKDDAAIGALSSLLVDDYAALRWIGGEELSEPDQDRTGLSGRLTQERTAANLIISIASIYRHLHRPFVILLDELEQFTRYDSAHKTRPNITWLKRLLEKLARAGALTLVAGHFAAWDVERDYLDRFSQQFALDLPNLSPDDVLDFVRVFTGTEGEFGPEEAAAVARLSAGNIRRVLALLHQLYIMTDGFTQHVPIDAITMAAQVLSARVEPERALESVTAELTQLGLRVSRRSVLAAGLSFDIEAEDDGTPVMVLDLKHATYQVGQYDQLRRFIERVRSVRRLDPHVIGCFLIDGIADERLTELVSAAEVPISLFSSTVPGYALQIRDAVEQYLRSRKAPSGTAQDPRDGSARRDDAALSALVADIDKVKQVQAELLNQVNERIGQQIGGDLITHVTNYAPTANTLESIYRESTKPIRTSQLLAMAFGGFRGAGATFLALLGITGLIVAAPLAYSLASVFNQGYVDGSSQDGWLVACRVLSIVLLGGGILLVVREYISIEQYYRQRDRVLYTLYVREKPASLLAEVSLAFDSYIQDFGPIRGRRRVLQYMRDRGLIDIGGNYTAVEASRKA